MKVRDYSYTLTRNDCCGEFKHVKIAQCKRNVVHQGWSFASDFAGGTLEQGDCATIGNLA
jgi:hypothetical protein